MDGGLATENDNLPIRENSPSSFEVHPSVNEDGGWKAC